MTGIARGRAVGSGRRRRFLVLTLFVVSVTTACTDTDPPPGGSPTASTVGRVPSGSPSASAPLSSSPIAKAPVLPRSARSMTPRGAESFFKYFMATYSFSYAHADAAPLRRLSDAQCSFCQSAIRRIERFGQLGVRFEGGDVTVRTVVAVPGGKPSEGVVLSSILAQARGAAKDREGAVRATTPARENLGSQARVRWVRGEWQMWALRIEGEG